MSVRTLMRIFLRSWCGEGSSSALLSTGLVSSRSPNTFLKCVAMFLCWTTLQWSSMDKITGYLQQVEVMEMNQSNRDSEGAELTLADRSLKPVK